MNKDPGCLSVRIFEDNYPIFNLVGDNMFENPFIYGKVSQCCEDQ